MYGLCTKLRSQNCRFFLNFFPLTVRYLDGCQRSLAVVKAVAELKIERLWL